MDVFANSVSQSSLFAKYKAGLVIWSLLSVFVRKRIMIVVSIHGTVGVVALLLYIFFN